MEYLLVDYLLDLMCLQSNLGVVMSAVQELRCRVIVSTLPPQLLAHTVSMSPPLDENSLNILRTTHTWMGEAAKGAVTYSRPFWRDKELAGALYSRPGPLVQMYDQCGHDGKHAAMVNI